MAHGYTGHPAWTAAAFVPDPFVADGPEAGGVGPNIGAGAPASQGRPHGGRLYRTGDLARWLPDGRIEYLGRLDHQVQVRGQRVEPDEIAAVLAGHPAVREVAVVAPEAAPGDVRLVAWVVARGDGPRGPSGPNGQSDQSDLDLRGWLGERLPRALVPAAVVEVAELPRTPSGKIDRRALLARGVPAEGLETGRFVAPRSPMEEVLAGLFEDVLGVERVGVHDGFFDLGGHSLLATRLVSRVRTALGLELPLRSLFETPTVAGLAAALEATESQGAAGAIERRTEDGPLPLSSSQERLWFLERFEPGNASLHIPGSVRLRGTLDPGALVAGLDLVVARHESLRTTFGELDGRPVQRVAPRLTLTLPIVDLSGLPAAAREATSDRWLESAAERPFDLARGPLLRALLLRLAPDDHLLSLVVHHVVADGWSMDVLVRELAAGYRAARLGEVTDLPELPIQYPDYAVWQRQGLASGALDGQLDYWRGRLGGAPPLELPTDRPRPAVQTFTGGEIVRTLPPALHDALRALGRRRGVTLFMTLLALLEVLLARLSGQDDLTVGTPIAGRRHEEVEGLIGLFLNSLALRTDLGDDPTFNELLDRVRTTALEAYAHQDVPFERILEEVLPERDLSRTPLFQVFFNMLNLPAAPIELPEVTLEPHRVPLAHAKFDLTIYAREDDDGISLDLVYNADLFDRPRMEELLRQLEHLAWQVADPVGAPERPIGTLSLVTADARSLLPAPEAPLGDAWEGALHDLVAQHAAATPDRTAVTDPDGSWSYAYLSSASARLAAALQAQGVTRGDRVVIFGHRSAGLVVSLLAVLESGGAFVVLDPAQPAPRLARTVELAAPRAFLALEAAGPVPAELDAALDPLGAPDGPGRARQASESSPSGPAARITVPAGSAALRCWLTELPQTPPGHEVEVGPDDAAYVAFTSGSTGEPKGILGRHGSLTHFVPWQRRAFGLDDGDRFSLLSGLAHDPLHRDVFTPLQLGGTVVVPEPRDLEVPRRLAAWMARERVTVGHFTPALGRLLSDAATASREAPAEAPSWAAVAGSTGREGSAEVRLPDLCHAFFVGEVLTVGDVERLRALAPAVQVVNYYGSTETQRAVGYHPIVLETPRHSDPLLQRAEGRERRYSDPATAGTAQAPDRRGTAALPLGRGMEDVQLLVLGPDDALCGIGELGEIAVRSPHVALGYLGDPALTAARFTPVDSSAGDGQRDPRAAGAPGERVYRTGDLGRYLPDGDVVFAGRRDRQVKVRGFRVEPAEIEAQITRSPTVRQAAVLLHAADGSAPRLVAFVVPEAGTDAAGTGDARASPPRCGPRSSSACRPTWCRAPSSCSTRSP